MHFHRLEKKKNAESHALSLLSAVGFGAVCLALKCDKVLGCGGRFCLPASLDETAPRVLGTEGSGRKHAAPKVAGAGRV